MWLAFDSGREDHDPLERILPQLEAIAQFADELRRRLATAGVGGIDGALEVYRRLRDVLDDVPRAELERMRVEVAELTRTLEEVARCLEHMARVKALVRE